MPNTPTHTPGPWKAQDNNEAGTMLRLEILANGGRYHIASVIGDAWDNKVDPGAWADARLIAAAPDMLRVLRLVLKRLDIEAAERGEDAVFLCNGLRGDIRAVIAQAEGGPRP